MDFTVTISDDLMPGVIAQAHLQSTETGVTVTPDQIVQAEAVARVTQVCQDLEVGPYYHGPKHPQFNADGTPYIASA